MDEALPDLKRLEDSLSSRYHCHEYRQADDCPETLITALIKQFPGTGPSDWEKRLNWGGVYLNGKLVSVDATLTVPCRIEYFEPKFDINKPESVYPPFKAEYVVYEHEELIGVFKPPGLSSMPTRDQKIHNLKAYVEDFCRCSIHMPSRLDTSASGLVMISRAPRMHARLQRVYENRTARKYYLLESQGKPDWQELSVDKSIARDHAHQVLRRVSDSGGKPALTHFRFLSQSAFRPAGTQQIPSSLLLAEPHTGRTHQIRVHAASIGFPIIGDNFYGGLPARELHLLSCRIVFPRPFGGEILDIALPPRLLPGWAPASSLTQLVGHPA